MSTKAYYQVLKDYAQEAVKDLPLNEPIIWLPLAKRMMAETGCGIDAAKRHLTRALNQRKFGELITSNWGGARPGASRPRKETVTP